MRILDFHVHAFPDALAEKAIEALSANAGGEPAETNGTVADTLRVMDAFGVEKAVLANIATKPAQAEKILEWSLEVRSDRLYPFGSVHPASTRLEQEVQAVHDAGLKGFKLHPLYQDFTVDDAAVFPLFDAIQQTGLPLLIHSGYDIAFGDDDRAAPWRFRAVIDRFPCLRMVLAHFGGWKDFERFAETMAGRNVFIDTSFASGYCSEALRDRIVRAHGVDKIIFGSDTPWGGMDDQLRYVEALPVIASDKEAILYGNAARLLNL